jgi:sulfur carrier protein ThiS
MGAYGVRITFKLFATLSQYLPRELDGHPRVGNQIDVDTSDGTAVQAVLDRFGVPPLQAHLVLVNGTYVAPARRSEHVLRDGDALAVWPMIAGG